MRLLDVYWDGCCSKRGTEERTLGRNYEGSDCREWKEAEWVHLLNYSPFKRKKLLKYHSGWSQTMITELSPVKPQGHQGLHGYSSNERLLLCHSKGMSASTADTSCWGGEALGVGESPTLRDLEWDPPTRFCLRHFGGGVVQHYKKQVDNSEWVSISNLPLGLQSQGLEKKAGKGNYNGELWMLLSRHLNTKTYMRASAFLLTNLTLRN